MHRVMQGPSRLVFVKYVEPGGLAEAQSLAAQIVENMRKKAPEKAILCADFRTEMRIDTEVVNYLTAMMAKDNALMERSAVLLSRNAQSLRLLNAVLDASTADRKRIASSNADDLLRWLSQVAKPAELAAAKAHFS